MDKKAFGIVSLLEINKDVSSGHLWNRLAEVIKPSGLVLPANPHFSWQVAEDYQVNDVLDKLKSIILGLRPFRVLVSGFGIFPGIHPVVYLTVVRNQILTDIHSKLWEECIPYAIKPNLYYAPEYWVPHITIAYVDLTADKVSQMVKEMIDQPWNAELMIGNVSLAYQNGNDTGIPATLLIPEVAN